MHVSLDSSYLQPTVHFTAQNGPRSRALRLAMRYDAVPRRPKCFARRAAIRIWSLADTPSSCPAC